MTNNPGQPPQSGVKQSMVAFMHAINASKIGEALKNNSGGIGTNSNLGGDGELEKTFKSMIAKDPESIYGKEVNSLQEQQKKKSGFLKSIYALTNKEHTIHKIGSWMGGNVYRKVTLDNNHIMQGKKKLIPAGQADFKIEKRGIDKNGKPLTKSPEGIDWGTHADQKDKEFRLLITDRAKDEKPKANFLIFSIKTFLTILQPDFRTFSVENAGKDLLR